MHPISSTALLGALAIALAACSTSGEWRRANRSADWLLTKLRTLKVSDRMNRDGDIRLADLERERLDLEVQIRVAQRDGRSYAKDGDEAGLQETIARLEQLEKQYEALAAKY